MRRAHVVRRLLLLLVSGLTAAGCLTGCGSQLQPAKVESTAVTSTPAPSAPVTPPPRPKVGACYRLTFGAATSPTSSAPPVPCDRQHNAVTVFVGDLDPIVDGHLLAVDSDEVQGQVAATCPGKVAPWIGGTEDDRRLSRFQGIWFSPTLRQSDAGANWFRCDLVAVRGDKELADLPGKAKDALDGPPGLDRFGTCGNSAPTEKGFARVICARPHRWRAVSVVTIPDDARYLGAHMQAAADDACKAEAQQRATDPLTLKWSFEWPTRQKWDDGQRYGLCWVPEAG